MIDNVKIIQGKLSLAFLCLCLPYLFPGGFVFFNYGMDEMAKDVSRFAPHVS